MYLPRIAVVASALMALVALPGAAAAQETGDVQMMEAHPTFVAEMSGFEEVPGAATLAKGFAGLQYAADGNQVYFTIVLTDSSTPINAAHLHLAPRGEAGPVVVPLCAANASPCATEGSVISGSFDAADFTGPFANDTLERLLTEARNGMVYVNVHSSKFPSGEARGQLADLGAMQNQPVPTMQEDTASMDDDMAMTEETDAP
jgi:hypothetical protein